MGTSRATKPTAPDPRDRLEVLRSKLVAAVVIAALDDAAAGYDPGGPESTPGAAATAAVLTTTAQEIRDWHAPKAEQNGAY